MSERTNYEDDSTVHSNMDGVTVASTAPTVATTASGVSVVVAEADSSELVSSDTSAFYADGSITYTQEFPGIVATSGVPITQNLESTAYTQPTVNLQLNDSSQTVESVQSQESLQPTNALDSVSISQSPGARQQEVSFPDTESIPPTNSSQSLIHLEPRTLPPQADPQYSHPDATIQSLESVPNSHEFTYPQDDSYQQSPTYQESRLAASSQTSQNLPPSSAPQGCGYAQTNTYHQSIFSLSQSTENPQPSPLSQESSFSQGSAHQEPQSAPFSQIFQNPQPTPPSQEPSQVSIYSQNSTYQQSPTFQQPQPAFASQTVQNSQPGPPFQEPAYSQSFTYQQPTTYQDSQPAASSQTLQIAPPDLSPQQYVGYQSSAYQEPYSDPQAAALSQASQDPQLADDYTCYTQARSQEYNGNIYVQSTSTMTGYNQIADDGNSSLLASGSDQPCNGDALDDNGVYEDGDEGATFATSVQDGIFPDMTINPAAVVNAAAGIANSAAGAMNNGAVIAQSAFSAVSRANPVTMINAGVGMASTVANAISGDPLAAVQAGVGVAMSGVRIAASIGTWNEARKRRKESAAHFAAVHGPADPAINSKVAIATQFDEILLVLSVLGQRLVVLEVINPIELPQALVACRTACAQADFGDLLAHFDTLDGTLQYTVTAALFFCAVCFPMHIYRGFGTGVIDDFLWGCPHPQYAIGQVAGFKSVDRMIAFLKSTPREVQLITRIPTGLSRIVPSFEKNEKNERRRLMNAYREFVREIENKGHPQPRDHSFRVVSWHIPFATWNSPFTFKNSGHYFEDFLRWQMDPGRLLHAWTIGGHLDLMHGEMMWLPPGIPECLARWLQGLPGTTFQLVLGSAFDYSHLRLSPATRRIMLEGGFETVKAVRDPQAHFRMPVVPKNIFLPAPPPIRKMVAAPVSQQPHLPNKTIRKPVSSQPGTNGGIQAKEANPLSSPMANQQITHPRKTDLAGTQRSVTSHDPPLSSIGNRPAAFQVLSPVSAPNSQLVAVYPPVSHNKTSHQFVRPDLIARHTAPQMIYRHPQDTVFSASQPMTQSPGSHAMGIRPHQQRAPPMPNVAPPNAHGQPLDHPMNLIATIPQPVLQHHQTPAMTQGSVSAVQEMPSDVNQYPAMSTVPQFTPTGPAQTHRLARKPTNSSRLSSAPDTAPTYPLPLPSNHANHQLNSHSPTSSISRASTVSSNHSSSSLCSGPPIQLLASPITSPQFPHTNPTPPSAQNPYYPQTQCPFPTQAANVIKRRVVPPPPPIHSPALRRVKAVHAFAPEQENELGFKIGDVLDILDDSSTDGWWEARLHGKLGAIPASYVGHM